MTSQPANLINVLACPVCGEPLPEQPGDTDKRGAARRRCCSNNHSFDRARQGYFNLLMVNQKKSRNPGDNADMVLARRRFLDGGFYQPIADAINQAIGADLAARPATEKSFQIADNGCGEGYYTSVLHQHLLANQLQHQLYGIDISRDAVKTACQRTRDIEWLVGSGGKLPFMSRSLDMIFSVFTPVMAEKWSTLLKPGASVWLILPAAEHLLELREHIYDEVQTDEYSPVAEMAAASFEFDQQQRMQARVDVPASAIPDLLTMTPHGWRIREDKRQQVTSLEGLNVTLAVNLYRFFAA
ncbi:putative RNA methyltransferase [Oceanobacter mangrovi]|uniref:putative RNA methyltransferase n=1 Tax=Oceanobacter mangrovi TaxID=2862510 RepID=UPI001C8CF8CA|nr:methyltransferase domain-containing protein [Oceanobacter mangrovi]